MVFPSVQALPAGGGQMDFISSVPLQAFTASALAANVIYAVRFRVTKPMTVTGLTYYISGSPSGNVDGGIYQSDGTTLTKLSSSGSTAASGSNTTQTLTFAAAVSLVPGVDYYMALAIDNATMTVNRIAGIAPWNLFKVQGLQKSTSFPLPTPITISGMAGAGLIPAMVVS